MSETFLREKEVVFNAWNNFAPFLSDKNDVQPSFSPNLSWNRMNPGKSLRRRRSNTKRRGRRKRRNVSLTLRCSGAGCAFWLQPSRQSQAVGAEPRNSEGRADRHSPGSQRPGCVSRSAVYCTTVFFSFLSCERRMRVGEAYPNSYVIGAGHASPLASGH